MALYQYREQANGTAITFRVTTIVFPYGDATPYLVFGDGVVPIEQPERFGRWDNAAWRRAYVRRFVEA